MTDHPTVDWRSVLSTVTDGQDLDEATAEAVLDEIMSGAADPLRTAGVLTALRTKGESGSEIAGFVRSMLRHVAPIQLTEPLVDTCGTGGDGVGTFNVSTVVALVVAASGVRVAKHGNRAASGTCGSADLLEGWGVVIDLPPAGRDAFAALSPFPKAIAAIDRHLGLFVLLGQAYAAAPDSVTGRLDAFALDFARRQVARPDADGRRREYSFITSPRAACCPRSRRSRP